MRVASATAVVLDVRDQLVMAHVDLVRSMASRLSRRLPPQVEVSELVSVGVMGLIDAASRFQPSLGVPFDAFARRRIHGAMLDSLRRLDWVPRAVRERRRAVDAAIAALRHRTGRDPEAEEIAAELGLAIDDYEAVLDEVRAAELATVRPAPSDETDGLLEVAIGADEGPDVVLERHELRAWLAGALRNLPERERRILALSYVEELTLAEIGEVLGVTESRVCQLRTQAIARLRTGLRTWLSAGAKAEAW